MKNYYHAQVRVFVDGADYQIIDVLGQGYNPNAVKSYAERQVREKNVGKMITSVVLNKVDLTLDEYKALSGSNPPWLIGE
jgi:hypothetical protein